MGDLKRRWVQTDEVSARSQSASPATDEDHVYVGGLGEELYALSRETGSVQWAATRDGALSDSSPVTDGETVYVGSGGGAVHAFDAGDGTEQWRHETDSAIASTPLVGDGTVYVGRDDGSVLAVATSDGSRRWRADVDTPVYADLARSREHDAVYVGTKSGTVKALAAASGEELWSRSFGTDVGAAAPILRDESVYYVANELVCLRAGSGQSTLATDFYGANAGASPAVADEYVYVAGANGNVSAVPREGPLIRTAPEWAFETRDTFVADPVVAGDAIVAASLEGVLYVIDRATGAERERIDLGTETRSTPVLEGDELYLGSRSGDVFSFELPENMVAPSAGKTDAGLADSR